MTLLRRCLSQGNRISLSCDSGEYLFELKVPGAECKLSFFRLRVSIMPHRRFARPPPPLLGVAARVETVPWRVGRRGDQ